MLCLLQTIMESFESGNNRNRIRNFIIFKNQNQNHGFSKNQTGTETTKIIKVPTTEKN